MRSLMIIGVAGMLLLGGCYEPLGELCHPSDPDCNGGCGGRECGLSPNGLEDCGSCGASQVCSEAGQCEGDCPSACADGHCPAVGECCLAGECGVGAWSCQEHQCACDAGACNDGVCPTANGCCQASDCGSGFWTCDAAHNCTCPGQACADGFCTTADGCCQDVVDDDQCGPDAICQDRLCQAGEAGYLYIDGQNCELANADCPADVLTNDGLLWTLLRDDLCFTDIEIVNGAWLTAPAVDADGAGGVLELCATGTLSVGQFSRLTMSYRGWGGGGGGGGVQYCDGAADCKFGSGGTLGADDPSGKAGGDGDQHQCTYYMPNLVGSGSGGTAGGFGGELGHNGGGCPNRCPNPPYALMDGAGGAGGGLFGGHGGETRGYGNKCPEHVCCDTHAADPPCTSQDPARGPEVAAEAGQPGGYAGPACNCDTSTDDSVLIGSGGGGGAGGDKSSGWCCGAADGGPGGAAGGLGQVGCGGGGGGGGGAAGGGAILVEARNIVIAGEVSADGAGDVQLGGGTGAGGGILLSARQRLEFAGSGYARSMGGFGNGYQGSTTNGGTIKLFFRELIGASPSSLAGRLMQVDLSE